ncbi:MoaE protein [Rhizoctonia solani]|uniref:MoaE protein n=1 Tax=Rhizoctonia solani TaxID=456999 RepID=A0A8H7M9C9_9AGAM|nr:MoaE protein [Rhizoctonia solani]
MNNTTLSESIDLEFSEPLTGDSFALSHASLDINNIMDSVRDNGAGALAVFVGTTRDNFNGKQVTRLEYEAYSKLAIKSMAKIATDARNLVRFTQSPPHDFGPTSSTPAPTDAASLTLIAIHHRLGKRESFYVCEWILEQIKMKTPIWKREWYAEGDPSNEAVWKANFPPQKAK